MQAKSNFGFVATILSLCSNLSGTVQAGRARQEAASSLRCFLTGEQQTPHRVPCSLGSDLLKGSCFHLCMRTLVQCRPRRSGPTCKFKPDCWPDPGACLAIPVTRKRFWVVSEETGSRDRGHGQEVKAGKEGALAAWES